MLKALSTSFSAITAATTCWIINPTGWGGPRRPIPVGSDGTAICGRIAYDLQYQLYSLALHRYLLTPYCGLRLRRHFGGVIYLFYAAWTGGRASRAFSPPVPFWPLIDSLDALFAGDVQEVLSMTMDELLLAVESASAAPVRCAVCLMVAQGASGG